MPERDAVRVAASCPIRPGCLEGGLQPCPAALRSRRRHARRGRRSRIASRAGACPGPACHHRPLRASQLTETLPMTGGNLGLRSMRDGSSNVPGATNSSMPHVTKGPAASCIRFFIEWALKEVGKPPGAGYCRRFERNHVAVSRNPASSLIFGCQPSRFKRPTFGCNSITWFGL